MLRRCGLVTLFLILAIPALAYWSHDPTANDTLCQEEGYQTYPETIPDGEGGVYVIWNDDRPDATSGYDLYMQRLDADGTRLWDRTGKLVLQNPSTVSSSQIKYQVIPGEEDGVYIVASGWGSSSTSQAFAQRVTPDGELPWGVDGVALRPGAPGSFQSGVHGVLDSRGRLVICFEFAADSSGAEKDLYIQCVSSLGNLIWGTAGLPICTATGDQSTAQLLAHPTEGTIALWYDDRDGGPNRAIRAMGFSDSGEPAWSAETEISTSAEAYRVRAVPFGPSSHLLALYGSLNGTSEEEINLLQLSSQGFLSSRHLIERDIPQIKGMEVAVTPSGGIWIVWQVFADGEDHDHCQYVDEYGVTRFPAGGIDPFAGPVDSGYGSYTPHLLVAPDGSACCYQIGFSLLNTAIWGQKVSTSGELLWTDQGLSISAPLTDKATLQVTDLGDGHYLVWRDWGDDTSVSDIRGQMVQLSGHLGDPGPRGLQAADAPHDQGGVMELSWQPSYLDAEAEEGLDRYTIWLRNAEAARAASTTDLASASGLPEESLVSLLSGGWIYAGEIEPLQLDVYGFLAPSMGDSTGNAVPLSEYMVMAHDQDGHWFESSVAGSWTVDNLAPSAPRFLTAGTESQQVQLNWAAPIGYQEDFSHYSIFRGKTADFEISSDAYLGHTSEPLFSEALPSGGPWYYRVTAVDLHGNESEPSNLAQVQGTSAVDEPPATFTLRGAYPNPFNPATTISYELPRNVAVTLVVHDVSGRVVKTLRSGVMESPGRHQVGWDGMDSAGQPVGSGVYLVRLAAGGTTRVQRVTLIK